MSDPKTIGLNSTLHQYVLAHSTPLDNVQLDLIAATSELGQISRMQIAPEQGAFMTLLARVLGVRQAVEVGTFTGYSALAIARGLAPGGRLLCCDVSEEWTAIARAHWRRAAVDDRIELKIGPAIETLRSLPREPHLDLAFIDADKPSYASYFDEIVPRLNTRGVLLVDNVMWSGRVVDPEATDEQTEAIRAFNAKVVADERVDCVMVPISDGLTMVVRRGA
jgi:caffeoyl-CoA O-methyltransferase